MINLDGEITPYENCLSADNRAFLFGDGVFETLKIVNGKILFFEDHYFRLMSSMRIIRMEIPMSFTMEYLEQQILVTARANSCEASARIRLTVFRRPGGRYLPATNDVSYLITSEPILSGYSASAVNYEVDLFKDFYVTRQLLSTLKTTSRLQNITASIYAAENGLQNCLLLNDTKNVSEAITGNIFMRTGNSVVTPPPSEGCINGVMRKQVISLIKNKGGFEISEVPISPFDLQKADEMFLTNVIAGVQSVTKYRKKNYGNDLAMELQSELNNMILV